MTRTTVYQTDTDLAMLDRIRRTLAERSPGETQRDYGTSRVVRMALRLLAQELGVELTEP